MSTARAPLNVLVEVYHDRPRADRSAVQEALYLYDLRTHSIREITEQAGISTSTLYKYLHERDAQHDGSL